MRYILLLVCLCAAFLHAAEIRGKVINSRGGEPLERVSVTLLNYSLTSQTSKDGTFVIPDVPVGHHVLVADTVGYWQSRTSIDINAADTFLEFEIVLQPEGGRRRETIEVS